MTSWNNTPNDEDRLEPGADEVARENLSMRRRGARKRTCYFCESKATEIDYKDVLTLRQFISDRGKIMPRRQTGTCAWHQRMLIEAIKRARMLALLPYSTN
jgi:small subunit ribosomal protein S18